jgi:hypothetical protein
METHGCRGTSNTHPEKAQSVGAEGRKQPGEYHRYRCDAQDQGEFASPLHRRNGAEETQGAFFFLLQSEDGDLFKVTIEHENEDVRAVRIKYFDTVPISTSLCILKSGYLFAASEFSDQ